MKAVWKSLWKLENAPDIVAIVVIVVVLAVDVFGPTDLTRSLRAVLVILGVLALGMLVERAVVLHRIESSLEGIKQRSALPVIERFYANRSELPPFEKDMEAAKEEIFAVGGSFGYLVGVQLGLLEKKARQGCRIKLLMMTPTVNGQENPLLEKMVRLTQAPVTESLTHSLRRILDAKRSLPSEIGQRIELKVYEEIPTLTLLFIDAERPTGRVRVELVPYGFDVRERPSFEIRPQAGGSLYGVLYARYLELWEASIPWPMAEREN